MLHLIILLVFWGSMFFLFHSYFGYPLSLWAASRVVPSREPAQCELPHVALIIAAYNEEDVIQEKIENSLELSYPAEKLSIIVFSDASSDRTDAIVKEYTEQGVELTRIEGRAGKTVCQNKVAARTDAEVLVFSDADSMYEPRAITELVDRFEAGVGCVVGELRYRESSDVEGESIYWRYESVIKQLESRVNSLVSGNGAIYAVRGESYVSLPRDSTSDFAEPLEIVRNSGQVKYAPDAVAWERTDPSTGAELARRIRIVTRSWNTISKYTDLLNPIHQPVFAYQVWSHKILRWFSPVFLGLALLSNVGLVITGGSAMYQLTLSGQVGFYLLAGVGALTDQMGIDGPLLTHVPYYFAQSNYGMLLGLWNFLSGSNIVIWETSARE